MIKALLKSTRPIVSRGLRDHLKMVSQPYFSGSVPKYTFSSEDPKEDPKEKTHKQEENRNDQKQDKDQKDKKDSPKTLDAKKSKEEKDKQNKKKSEQDEKKPEEEISNEEPKKKKQGGLFEGLNADYFKNLNIQDFFNPEKNPKFSWSYVGAGVFLGALALYYLFGDDETISYNAFRTLLDSNSITKIVIVRSNNKNQTYSVALIYTGQFDDTRPKKLILGNVDHFLETLEKAQLENGRTGDKLVPVEFTFKGDASQRFDQFMNLMWILVSVGVLFSLIRSTKGMMNQGGRGGGGNDIFGMSKSGVQIFGLDQKIPIRFKDVAGLDEAKLEITEFVEFLKKPKKFKEIGAKIPRGALLAGPPGTGKTLLAKAAAGEAGVPFLYISGSDFVEMFVGVGASRVRDLFKKAKTHAPSIIFIDEIDAVGRKREGRIGGNDERDSTLNQLLVEMDGFGTDTSVVVMAATNRKELLDPALTRPGRFDRSIDVTLPDIEGRKHIFMIHLKPLKLDPAQSMEEYAKRLATLTPGFSGAEIHNLCNEAAILAARKNKKFVSAEDFEAAAERVMAGLEKKKIVTEEERRTVAVHESGHAVVSWFLEGGNPLLKLTIIPRSKGSLGYAQYLPNESSLETKEELLDRICCILGGRCSEELFNGKVTTGAYDDLKKAYEVAYAIVTKFGMSERLGFLGIPDTEYVKRYSDETNKIIDEEIKKIIDECTEKTRQTVRKYKEQIEGLSKALLEKETLDLNQINAILGPRPFPPKSNFKAYLEVKNEMDKESQEKKSEQQSAPSTN